MYLIENLIVNGILTNIYNIHTTPCVTANDFITFLNELTSICDKNHQTLEDYIKNNPRMENGDTIIHYVLKNILYIPLYYPSNNIVVFNNRYDVQLNPNIYIEFWPSKNRKYISNSRKFLFKNYDYTHKLMYFLFILLSKIDNSILMIPDSNGHTPIELLIQNKHIYNQKNCKYGSLLTLLTYGTKIIIIQQSYIRRYLARRHVIKIKKKKIFDAILYAPTGYIEYNTFKYFCGGYKYTQVKEQFNTKQIASIRC